MALSDKQRPTDFTMDDKVAAAIRARSTDEKLPCAQAFIIARELEIAPLIVGQHADALEIHLTRCQLGLFGYPGEKEAWKTTNLTARPVPEGLEAALRAAVDDDGHLACAAAWEIAAQFEVPKMQVGYLADRLEIKITPCQLGAF
jgi:hypothetical protein